MVYFEWVGRGTPPGVVRKLWGDSRFGPSGKVGGYVALEVPTKCLLLRQGQLRQRHSNP